MMENAGEFRIACGKSTIVGNFLRESEEFGIGDVGNVADRTSPPSSQFSSVLNLGNGRTINYSLNK